MKRYRVFGFDWNSTGDQLDVEIKDDWEETVKELHRQNRENTMEWLRKQYGEWNLDGKIRNLTDIGGQAFSVSGYPMEFYKQAREAFIVGSYYPALTAACAHGERILNYLIIGLRDDYQNTPEYADFATMTSSSNWRKMIRTLESWNVLVPSVASAFRDLLELRHRAIHFNQKTDERQREMAMEALKLLDEIISVQFGAFRFQPWFIPGIRGAVFICKDWEAHPFVKLVLLPQSLKVGPNHWMELVEGTWAVHDIAYENREITDEEFARLQETNPGRPKDTAA